MTNESMLQASQFLLYTAPSGAVKVQVFFKAESVWLTQKALADLFGVKVPAINKHLKNIFASGELVEDSVISILETTATDAKRYLTNCYNLDAIIAVGYRVNSFQATQFRIWAIQTLREFITKGFVLDDDRLKQAKAAFGKDFFASVQNKLHWAITGQTAAERIYTTADATKITMGLTTWKAAPHGKILKSELCAAL